jgi:hypothetical protein
MAYRRQSRGAGTGGIGGRLANFLDGMRAGEAAGKKHYRLFNTKKMTTTARIAAKAAATYVNSALAAAVVVVVVCCVFC